MNPLISIIIPTYNRAKIIRDTLNSVVGQTFQNWECIVVDDRSSDETTALIDQYIQRDQRIKYFLKPKGLIQGASVSRNYGLSKANGEYIQFLDSDDILADNKLEEQILLLSRENEFAISTCKWGIFSTKDEPVTLFENRQDFKSFDCVRDYFNLIGEIGGFFPPHSFLVHRKLIAFSGHWNEDLTLNDDGEFFFRIISNSRKILFAENTFVRYRLKREDNLSTLNSISKAQSLINSWRIIESLYITRFSEDDSLYLYQKKNSVYNEIKKKFPLLILKNNCFFNKQITNDTFLLRLNKLHKKLRRRLREKFSY